MTPSDAWRIGCYVGRMSTFLTRFTFLLWSTLAVTGCSGAKNEPEEDGDDAAEGALTNGSQAESLRSSHLVEILADESSLGTRKEFGIKLRDIADHLEAYRGLPKINGKTLGASESEGRLRFLAHPNLEFGSSGQVRVPIEGALALALLRINEPGCRVEGVDRVAVCSWVIPVSRLRTESLTTASLAALSPDDTQALLDASYRPRAVAY
jgi:hypothetical protein